MSSEIAIRVERLGKCYHVYDSPRDRLKQFAVPRLRRILHRPAMQYFREFWALRDVSFEVRRGETVGIVGCNGSGKSTLLQLICGTVTPTHGNVETAGRISALLELGAGFNPEFTGRENIYLNGAVLGLGRAEIDARFDKIAAFADIGSFIEQPVKTYSSGMYVRLAFAVQASVDPDILVVDEALAVGDERFQRKCFARIESLKANGAAILFVSHSPAMVTQLCDRAILLDKGSRLLFDSPTEVIKAYQKLIYSPAEARDSLVQRMQKSDPARDQSVPGSDGSVSGAGAAVVDTDDSFDASMVPESTVAYPIQGARIDGFEILDSRGQRVNVLSSKKRYSIVMHGKFLEECEAVYFGLHVKNIAGTEITGQRFPAEGRSIASVRAGASFRVEFAFTLMLGSGAYFVGGGVWSAGGPKSLHRILDATMFRVMPGTANYSFGSCDLSEGEPVCHIE